MTEDDTLMVRLQEGDSAAFDELVARYQGPLLGFFYRNTRDRQLSEDFAQETLLRVYNQSWDYLPSGRFRGWIYRIARNLLVDNIRRQSHDALIHAFTGQPRTAEPTPSAASPPSSSRRKTSPPSGNWRPSSTSCSKNSPKSSG